MSLLNFFRRSPRPVKVVHLPEALGAPLSAGEISQSLIGRNDDVMLRALGQLLYFRSTKLTDAGCKDAWKGQDTRFQLGGANALTELLGDVLELTESGKIPEDLKEFFRPS